MRKAVLKKAARRLGSRRHERINGIAHRMVFATSSKTSGRKRSVTDEASLLGSHRVTSRVVERAEKVWGRVESAPPAVAVLERFQCKEECVGWRGLPGFRYHSEREVLVFIDGRHLVGGDGAEGFAGEVAHDAVIVGEDRF